MTRISLRLLGPDTSAGSLAAAGSPRTLMRPNEAPGPESCRCPVRRRPARSLLEARR